MYSYHLCIRYHRVSCQPPAGPGELQESDKSSSLLSHFLPHGVHLSYLNPSVNFNLLWGQSGEKGEGDTETKQRKEGPNLSGNPGSRPRHHPMLAVPVVRVERLQRDLWEGHADPPADAQVSGRARGLQRGAGAGGKVHAARMP